MNKKLLFAAMSLAALTACTNDDFESKQQLAEETSPIQFEVINNAFTRASMDGNTVVWSANDGDLFTLYHGAAAPADGANLAAPYQNATYKATATDGSTATLSTPSMILQGSAIMVWPVDTTFRATIPAGQLTVKIPADQPADVQNQIPYVSDLIDIAAYSNKARYNEAGLNRAYPVFMRPMASQLNLKTDYAGTDATLAALYEGDDPIEQIKVKSMELLTTAGGGTTDFTTEIPLKFKLTAPGDADQTRWDAAVPNNAWSHVTQFDVTNIAAGGQTDKLTTKALTAGNKGGKFLILPQAAIAGGLANAGVVVKTLYGKVVIAAPGDHATKYNAAEYSDAWYRFLPAAAAANAEEKASSATPEASGDNVGLYKTVAQNPSLGMQQTINYMSTYVRNSATSVVNTEPIGVALNRYVVVLLNHLDMSDLHVNNDKWLRDAARVWKKMGLASATVYLDGDANGEFEISQKTIKTINDINAAEAAAGTGKFFHVMPCNVAGEVCDRIIITGASEIKNIQNMAFITNATKTADVVLKAGEEWTWNGTVTIATAGTTGIASIINEGTMVNGADVTLNTFDDVTPNPNAVNILFVNDGIWNITAKANVQNAVINNGVINISEGARYLQDGANFVAASLFINEGKTLPARFGVANEQIGKVNNNGTFATVAKGEINNYGLIEHANDNCKTYITRNQVGTGFAANFAYNPANPNAGNKIGRINIPWTTESIKASNVSISAGTSDGFVSVTVKNVANLQASTVGSRINYIIVKEGVKQISKMPAGGQIKYVEFDSDGEIAWNLGDNVTETFDGLVVLSDVNVKIKNTVNVNRSVYLNADMYVAGNTNITKAKCDGYFGDTQNNWDKMYIEW